MTTQRVCGLDCAKESAKKTVDKLWKANDKKARAELKIQKEKLKTRAQWLKVWTMFAGAVAVGVAMMAKADWFAVLENLTGIYEPVLGTFAWFLPNVGVGIFYLRLVARGTAAARYANR